MCLNLLCRAEKEEINKQKNIAEELSIKYIEAEEENKRLNLLLNPPETPKPLWLDDRKTPYQPKVQVVAQFGGLEEVIMDSKDIYTTSPTLENIVEQKKWRELPLNQKFNAIWDFVCRRVSYTYDNKEAWNFPQTTYWREKGDCEDSTILFVTLCRLAGVPSDRVFNALGWFKKGREEYGHSWAICKLDNDEWYIFETTLVTRGTPKKFKGDDNYFADWGVANWSIQGEIIGGNQI